MYQAGSDSVKFGESPHLGATSDQFRATNLRMASVLRCLAPLLVFAGACIEPQDRPASWSYIHAAIIAPSCATPTCHGALGARGGIVLDDRDDAYERLLGDRYVVPGASTSPLLYQLEGDERQLMPPDAPLPQVDVELIRTWIVEGAAP